MLYNSQKLNLQKFELIQLIHMYFVIIITKFQIKFLFLHQIVNVCAIDSQRLFEGCIMGNFLISSIVMLVAATIATQLIIGTGALIGTVCTFLLFFPIQVIMIITVKVWIFLQQQFVIFGRVNRTLLVLNFLYVTINLI